MPRGPHVTGQIRRELTPRTRKSHRTPATSATRADEFSYRFYPYHDWKEDPQGNTLLQRIADGRPGRSDILKGLDRWHDAFGQAARSWIAEHRANSGRDGADQGTGATPGEGVVSEPALSRKADQGSAVAGAAQPVSAKGDGLDALRNELTRYLGPLPEAMFDPVAATGREAGIAESIARITGRQVVFFSPQPGGATRDLFPHHRIGDCRDPRVARSNGRGTAPLAGVVSHRVRVGPRHRQGNVRRGAASPRC
jgi:hypothetical protein